MLFPTCVCDLDCFPDTNSCGSEFVRSQRLEHTDSSVSPTTLLELNTTSVSFTLYTVEGDDNVLHKLSITVDKAFFREPVKKLKVIDIYICTYRDIQYMYNLVLYNYKHSGLNLVYIYIYLNFKGLSEDLNRGYLTHTHIKLIKKSNTKNTTTGQ